MQPRVQLARLPLDFAAVCRRTGSRSVSWMKFMQLCSERGMSSRRISSSATRRGVITSL